jgi:hypothetical protein
MMSVWAVAERIFTAPAYCRLTTSGSISMDLVIRQVTHSELQNLDGLAATSELEDRSIGQTDYNLADVRQPENSLIVATLAGAIQASPAVSDNIAPRLPERSQDAG